MHGFWLGFEPRWLEEEYLSARAHRLQQRFWLVAQVAFVLRAISVISAWKHGSLQFLSCFNALWGFVEVTIWRGDGTLLAPSARLGLVFASRILNAIFWCFLSPFFNIEGQFLSPLIMSGILLHLLPVITELPFQFELPSQVFVTVVCLLVAGKGSCKNGFGGDLSVAENRWKAMYMVFESRQGGPPCCLHVFMVIHTVLGSVVVPYFVWCRELHHRVQFLDSIPEDRIPPGSRLPQNLPRTMHLIHLFAMVYLCSVLSKCIGESSLPVFLETWGWCLDIPRG